MRLKIYFLYFLLGAAFLVLVFRLASLTIVQGSSFRELAEGQRIRLHRLTAARGMIFDRNGRPLVRNVPLYKRCHDGKCEVVGRDEALKLESQNRDSDITLEVGREYLYSEATAHLLGYLGEATDQEVKDGETQIGQMLGRTGIEEQYELQLRGKDGVELIEVDTRGETLRKIGRREPVPGKDIFLSIDINLQKAAYEALGGKRGAVVVSDPRTGQILALVSSPSFDPNILAGAEEVDTKKIEAIFTNPDKPLFNRAISGAYPPGSTFKIVVAAAGLEEEKITKSTKMIDTGQIVIGPYKFANWLFTRNGGTEGEINVVRAITRSTDTFFYKLGELVGADDIVRWAETFGIGKAAGIDLTGEIDGFLPKPKEGEWFLGNTYHLSIGQGSLGLTPLQDNRMTDVVASGGKLCPVSVKVREPSENSCQQLPIKQETLQIIKEGMIGACSPGGTAGVFFNFKPQVACKTGTAEFDDPAGRTHAWFTSFAPLDSPQISVTALVEAGGEGSTVAAPIAKKVMEEYFRK